MDKRLKINFFFFFILESKGRLLSGEALTCLGKNLVMLLVQAEERLTC